MQFHLFVLHFQYYLFTVKNEWVYNSFGVCACIRYNEIISMYVRVVNILYIFRYFRIKSGILLLLFLCPVSTERKIYKYFSRARQNLQRARCTRMGPIYPPKAYSRKSLLPYPTPQKVGRCYLKRITRIVRCVVHII